MRADLARTDIVVVPHHGSRSSSSEAFVSRVQPRVAIVSAGAGNRWHFPHEVVVERWCRSGAEVISSADWGAITIAADSGRGLTGARSQRLEQRRYWQAPSPLAGRSRCLGAPGPAKAVYAPDGAVSSAAVSAIYH